MNNIKVKELSNYNLFPAGYAGSHSYRIPSLLKLKSGKLLAIVDQRIESQLDAPYSTINQFLRESKDNGKTWTDGKVMIHLEKFNENRASAIDGVVLQKSNQELFFAVDVYPGGSGLMPMTKLMNPLADNHIGYTPDGKYLKFHQTDSTSKFILKKVTNQKENQNWLQAYKLKDNKFENTQESNLEKTKIFVNNSFDAQSSTLRGGVYENVEDLNNITTKPVCSIWDGFDNRDPKYVKPKYYVDSTAYLYLFKSKDDGQSWELVTLMNNEINRKDKSMNCLVLGPGQGLELKYQKDVNKNGRLLLPFYEVNYALPSYAFVAFSDNNGLNWKPSKYINQKSSDDWHWLSETQIIETKNGKLFAFSRNPEQNQYCISQSINGGESWNSLNDSAHTFSTFKYKPLNAEIMHGLVSLSFNGDEYILLTLPTIKERKNGKLFMFKNGDLKDIKPIFDIDQDGDSFGYSTLSILEKSDKYVDVGILYEVSKQRNEELKWVGFASVQTEGTKMQSEILFKKIRIEFN